MLPPAGPCLAGVSLIAALHEARCLTSQIPGAFRLLQVLQGSHLGQKRSIAQPARQMEESATHRPHSGPARQQQQQHQSVSAVTAPYSPPTGVKKTFYKRKLPCPPATEFSSADGRLLFAEALQQGTMTGFFKLIEQYSTQDEPAFCGLASIAMVLNALSIDPKRPWKGSWRWFHEQLLDCCLPLNTVAKEGVVLTQAACLAKCNGANVTLHRYGTFSLGEFRQAVADVCSSGEEHLVVSYSRKTFSQTGDGHFSPVGGYHAGRDLVLILDTARFKYPPHWVPLSMLYESMAAVDAATGQPRGFLRLSVNTRPDSVLFTLDIRSDGSWREAEHFIQKIAPEVVRAAASTGQSSSAEALLARLVSMAPLASAVSFIAMRYAAHICAKDRCVPHTVRQQVLQELRATPLHQLIQPLLAQLRPGATAAEQHQQHQQHSHHQHQQQHSHQQHSHQQQPMQQDFLSEKLTMLLLLQEPSAWGLPSDWADPQQHKQWQQLMDASAVSIIEGEVQYMRQQLMHIEEVLLEGREGAAATVCSSCPFQLDCTVKGCVKGDLRGSSSSPAAAGTAVAPVGACAGGSGSAAAGPCGVDHHYHHHQQQQQHVLSGAVAGQHSAAAQHAAGDAAAGCCGSGPSDSAEQFGSHACCS